MLDYTGHPLYDVGLATITAFAGKDDPTELVEADLDVMSDYIGHEYIKNPLKSFLTVAFTSNAWFSQDAYNPDKSGLKKEEREERQKKRDKWKNHHLKQWNSQEMSVTEYDVFTGEPAIAVELSGKLKPGRAGRAQIPLTLGDECINFYHNGDTGLSISGKTLLAIQAMPLGAAKSGGRLLMVHSDNRELMLHFAHIFLEQNKAAIQMACTAGSSKIKEADYKYRTLLIHTLMPAKLMQQQVKKNKQPFSITAYHFSNGKKPSLDIYHLPLQVIGFLKIMMLQANQQEWFALVKRNWEKPSKKLKKKARENFKPQRNWLYESLFTLPQHAVDFIKRFFLAPAVQQVRAANTGSDNEDVQLVPWKIISIFLRRVINMEQERIDKIRKLGDNLAQYVISNETKGKRFFRNFRNTNYTSFRNSLLRVLSQEARQGNLLFSLDDYMEIFELADNAAYTDWSLARDLLYIRMIEQLHLTSWAGFSSEEEENSEEDTENETN